MKKYLTLLLISVLSLPAMSQEDVFPDDLNPLSVVDISEDEDDTYPALQYSVATNGFWSNWFLQLGANWTAFYSDQEHGLSLSKSPFKSFRANPALSISIGKHTSPNIALRLKLTGFWGRSVMSDSSDKNDNNTYNIQFQPMINLVNLFDGYKEDRIWDMSLFFGAGFNHSDRADMYALSISAGLHSSWRVSPSFNLYAELGLIVSEYDADGLSAVERSSRNRLWMNHDNMLYAELGIRVNIGRVGWRKSVDIDAVNMLHQAETDALNAQIADINAENDRMRQLLSDAQLQTGKTTEADTIREVAYIPVSVFFEAMSSKITDRAQLSQCIEFVEYVKQSGDKVLVEGYADAATGDELLNLRLSERRANAFADELVKMGIPRESIVVKASGGVDKLSPSFLNRRATAIVLSQAME